MEKDFCKYRCLGLVWDKMIKGKIWGWTLEIFKNDNFEVHLIYVKKNYTCSEHVHHYKFNMFFIIFGELIIKTWKNDYPLIDKTTIKIYEKTCTNQNEWHSFKSKKKTLALEIYFTKSIDEDIERRNAGCKILKKSKL